MGWFSDNEEKDKTLRPEEVPPNKLTPLSRKYINWRSTVVFVLAIMLVMMFINVFITNPTVTGSFRRLKKSAPREAINTNNRMAASICTK